MAMTLGHNREPKETIMQITFTEHLKGRTVLDEAGHVVGTVEEILIDGESWRMEGLRVKVAREAGKEIGAQSGIFHSPSVDVPRPMIKAAGDAVILSVPRSALHGLVEAPAPEAPPAGEPPPSSGRTGTEEGGRGAEGPRIASSPRVVTDAPPTRRP
jgi:sporulation protein YlmC with PRC-barrel domain